MGNDANIACVATTEGVWFLDIDDFPVVSEQILNATGHELAELETLVVKSSGEKRHFYFKQNAASRALGNVDYDSTDGKELFSARVVGKYVVGPLSVHPNGHEYDIVSNCEISEAPVWLTDYLRTAKTASHREKAKLVKDETVKIAKGGRDTFLFDEARRFRDARIPESAAVAALQVINQERCAPPMASEVVKAKVKSAYTREPRAGYENPVVTVNETGPAPIATSTRADTDRGVLDGRLGELCERNMLGDFPVSYAWPALVTAAAVIAPNQLRPDGSPDESKTHNLYTALVGKPGSGKSQAAEWAMSILGLKDDPRRCLDVKAGSAERLLKYLNELHDRSKLSTHVLLDLDEWGYLFGKAAIENAIYPTMMTTGFYKGQQTILDSQGRPLNVPATLSWLGGIVDDAFEDCFNRTTTLGLYDRFMLGFAPSDFSFQYRPFDGETLDTDFAPVPVHIDRSVYEAMADWRKKTKSTTRESEIALRVAYICASFDGRKVLHAKDLGPHLILAAEQLKVRAVLKPNAGENPSASRCWLAVSASFSRAAGFVVCNASISSFSDGISIFSDSVTSLRAFNSERSVAAPRESIKG